VSKYYYRWKQLERGAAQREKSSYKKKSNNAQDRLQGITIVPIKEKAELHVNLSKTSWKRTQKKKIKA
jgi:hypothetical protein